MASALWLRLFSRIRVGKSLPLGLLHALQPLRHLSCSLLAAGGHGGHLPVVLQDALEHRLGVGHLRVAHDVADHPARQLHLGVLVFGSVREPAHHLGLDGVVYVHQHVEPFRTLHAGCARHARFLCRRAEECRSALLHAAHGLGVVHDGLVLFHRVAVPVSLRLPQLHAVAPGLGDRLCPASVPLHKLGLGLAVLVYRVGQVMQVGILIPEFRVPVGCLIQHLACQRLGQSLRLGHVRSLRAQIFHQRPRLLRQLRPVGPAAVDLGPPDGEAFEGGVRESGVLRQAEELVQGIKGRSLLRQYPACLPLLVVLCLPVGLFGLLETYIRQLIQNLGALGIVSGFVLIYRHTLLLQTVHQRLAGVVRQDSCLYLIKAHRTLRFSLKIPGRDSGHIFVQLPYHLGCVLTNDVAFFCKDLADRCGCLASLCSSQQNVTQYFPLFKAVVRVGFCLAAQLVNNLFNLAVCLFQQRLIFFFRHLL